MDREHGAADCQWVVVTMDDGTVVTIGAGWTLPPGYPHYVMNTIEFVGTEGSLYIDDTHRDMILNTMGQGMVLPLSTQPGEPVLHVFQGPMEAETVHFGGRGLRPASPGDTGAGEAGDGGLAHRRARGERRETYENLCGLCDLCGGNGPVGWGVRLQG